MKTGIITFHRAINYGAVLQAFALKRKIEELGAAASVIDYINPKDEKGYNLIQTSNLKSFISSLLKYVFRKKKYIKFIDFRNRHLNLTSEIKNKNDLKLLNKRFDAFITGSDQVWNYNITDGDMVYLLDFADIGKRNSYAASFGVTDISEKYKEEYKKILNDFSNISVREKAGARIIQELCYKKVPVVLDPTLLLDRFEWEKIAKPYKRNKYILIYLLAPSEAVYKLAEKLSDDFNLEIIVISVDFRSFKFGRKYKCILTAGPEEFLGLFTNAEYVITNSFHGTVFSIIFNKKLIVDYLKDKGRNTRLENILHLFNLENRVLKNDNYLELCTDVNYKNVNIILENQRKKSINYLKGIFNTKN